MTRSFQRWTTGFVAMSALIATAIGGEVVSGQGRAAGFPPAKYQVVPLWPHPLNDQWILGSVTGVAVDAQNHIWLVHRGGDSLQTNEKGISVNASSICCMAAPPVLEFNQDGSLAQSWGGPSTGYQWPQAPGGITVDSKGNVWIAAAGLDVLPTGAGGGRGGRRGGGPPPAADPAAAAPAGRGGVAPTEGQPPAAPAAGRGAGGAGGRGGAAGGGAGRGATPDPASAGPADAHVLKFSNVGRYMMTIGTPGKMEGPDSHTTLNRPAAVAYDAAANEVFIADSGNHRIVVFDADSGAYKRHWFAYGEKTPGPDAGPYDPAAAQPSRSFRDVTCVEIAKDGMVYVCDRTSNRIQVFDRTGKFIKEKVIAKQTGGATVSLAAGATAVIAAYGSVWDLAFSNDAAQQYLLVADGVNKKVRVLQRDTLEEVSSFGSGGRLAGQFVVLSSIATDAQGNVYTGETHHGKRIQKFVGLH
jgi:NHL repeat